MALRSKAILALACLAALTLDSCRSSRIESGSSNSALSTRKSEVMKFLDEAETRVTVTTYEAKNAKASVTYSGGSVKVKSNITFTQGDQTKMTARLIFPPVSVGTLTVDSKAAKVSSKYLNKEMTLALPTFANEILQSALLGNLPPVYKYFGDSDFSNFNIYLDSNDIYELSRSEAGTKVLLGVNGQDKTLAYARVIFGKYDVKVDVASYQRFSGKLMPSAVGVTALTSGKQNTKLDIEISDVTLQEK